MRVPCADNQALRAKAGVIKAPANRGIMKMNHFHPTILIVLVERHPHALHKSSLNAGR